MLNETDKIEQIRRNKQFLAEITEGSAEHKALLWFENAHPDVRKSVFVQLLLKSLELFNLRLG